MRCTTFWNIESEPGMRSGRTSPGPTSTQSGTDEQRLLIEKWSWYFQALRWLRDSLIEKESTQSSDAKDPVESHSMHPADSASDEFDHNLALAILSGEEHALFEIDAALRRILEGTYGICQESGKPIAEERLRAVPWTRYTKEVADRLERHHSITPHLAPVESLQHREGGISGIPAVNGQLAT